MRHQVTVSRLDPKDPRIRRWVYVMAHHGGGGPKFFYDSAFFLWLRGQLLMIEYYSYEEEDFRENPELPLPEGQEWDDRGKKDTIHHIFNFLIFILH